jgi:hypothetical protein
MSRDEEVARGLRRPRSRSTGTGKADWMEADASLIQKAVAKASFKRCALRFGYSRDSGAYAVGVYAGDDYFTDYIRPGESIDDYLRELIVSLDEYMPGEALTSTTKKAQGKR